jgi:hypothetical protein
MVRILELLSSIMTYDFFVDFFYSKLSRLIVRPYSCSLISHSRSGVVWLGWKLLQRSSTRHYKQAKTQVRGTFLIKMVELNRLNVDMAATMQRLDEYRTYNQQFCQRILGFLPMMITYQVSDLFASPMYSN